MNWFWQNTKGKAGTRRAVCRAGERRRTQLTLEALEDRRTPSVMGAEFAVNPPPASLTQGESATARSLTGDRSVIVYTQTRSDGQGQDILAQLYGAGGNRLGGQITVATSGQYTIPL